MEKFCTITPTRDRPRMFSFCREQLRKQTLQPTASYFINYDAEDSQPDLVKRIRSGIELAKRDGIDIVFILEDDDRYPSDYLKKMYEGIKNVDFVGYADTYYYSLKSKTWMHQGHPGRSSLFCTGFRISALDRFIWPPDHYLWLDVKLWEYARDRWKKVNLMMSNPCLGIKGHGEGIYAGKSHVKTFDQADYDMNFLMKRTDEYQFNFYKQWKV